MYKNIDFGGFKYLWFFSHENQKIIIIRAYVWSLYCLPRLLLIKCMSLSMTHWLIELNQRINGYNAGFEKDEYDCNLDTCECAHFNQYVIGNIPIDW